VQDQEGGHRDALLLSGNRIDPDGLRATKRRTYPIDLRDVSASDRRPIQFKGFCGSDGFGSKGEVRL